MYSVEPGREKIAAKTHCDLADCINIVSLNPIRKSVDKHKKAEKWE